MKGELIDRGDGKWGCKVYCGRLDGKRKYRFETVYGSKAEAEKRLRIMVGKAEAGDYLRELRREAQAASSPTVGEYLDRWLEKVKGSKRRRTYSTYKHTVETRIKPRLGDVKLADLSREHVIAMIEDLHEAGGEDGDGLSARSVRKAHEVLRNALGWAVEDGFLASNPAKSKSVYATLPKIEHKERDTVRPEQVAPFLEAAKGVDFGAYFVLLLGSGLRPEEALALRWSDFDGQAVHVNRVLEDRPLVAGVRDPFEAPKTDKSRRAVALPSWAVDALEAHREAQVEQREKAGAAWHDSDLIFPDEAGRPLPQHRTAQPWKRLKKAAGLPASMRIYDLRHSCASLLLADGEPVKVVQERLGHSTAVLTMDTYAHVIEGAQRQAASTLERIANGG